MYKTFPNKFVCCAVPYVATICLILEFFGSGSVTETNIVNPDVKGFTLSLCHIVQI